MCRSPLGVLESISNPPSDSCALPGSNRKSRGTSSRQGLVPLAPGPRTGSCASRFLHLPGPDLDQGLSCCPHPQPQVTKNRNPIEIKLPLSLPSTVVPGGGCSSQEHSTTETGSARTRNKAHLPPRGLARTPCGKGKKSARTESEPCA